MKKGFVILAVSLLPFLISVAQDSQTSCQIIAYTDCDTPYSCKTLSLFEPQNRKYVEIDSLKPEPNFKFLFFPNQFISFAPNQSRIAVQEVSTEDPLPEFFSMIFIYDTDKEFHYRDTAVNALMAPPSAWSGDGDKFLYWDAWGHYHLSQLDFAGEDDGDLWPAPPIREIRGYVPKWSLSGEYIAVVGEEYPFPVSEHATNDVQALYIAEPEIGATPYTPISDPERSVSWNFEWLTDDQIAYTDGRLRIATASGETLISIEGDYTILGKLAEEKLLVGHTAGPTHYELSMFDAQSSEFSQLTTLPIDETNTFPRFNLSPDNTQIAYVDLEGKTLFLENFQNHSKHQFAAPVPGRLGWWTPDGSALLFFDYGNNVVYEYDVDNQTLSEMTATEMFEGQDTLPQYPNWICPAN